MARPLSWSDVRGGLVALAVLVGVAFGVLRYLRVGALHGDTVHVYALVSEARGLTPGSEVWLNGQKIGKVSRIDFRPVATSDTSTRLLVEMQVLSAYRDAVHKDATAQIRAGGSLIGAVVMYLTPGTVRTASIDEGDTVRATPQSDFEGASAKLGEATSEVEPILANVKVMMAGMQSTRGTIGAFMNGPGFGQLGEARIRASRVVNRLSGGGTAGLVMRGGLSARAGVVLSRVDSVRALLASPHTSLGRFRRDSTLLANVADIRGQLAEVQQDLDESRGTAGRVLHDSAATSALAGAQREMTLLLADLKAHPLRYLSF